MLTKKAKYALKALATLSELGPGEVKIVSDIAAKDRIPKKFLDTILLDLRNAGFLVSRQGPSGGYALARPASEIAIGNVIRTLDGPLAPLLCASRTALEICKDCNDPDTCQIRWAMTDVRDAIASILDQTSLADFVKGGSGGNVVT